jgi:hypothetical protein
VATVSHRLDELAQILTFAAEQREALEEGRALMQVDPISNQRGLGPCTQ